MESAAATRESALSVLTDVLAVIEGHKYTIDEVCCSVRFKTLTSPSRQNAGRHLEGHRRRSRSTDIHDWTHLFNNRNLGNQR